MPEKTLTKLCVVYFSVATNYIQSNDDNVDYHFFHTKQDI